MSKREARARRRRISRLRSLAADPRFQRAVLHLRTLTGLSPQERRDLVEPGFQHTGLGKGTLGLTEHSLRWDFSFPQDVWYIHGVLDKCTLAAFGIYPQRVGRVPIPKETWREPLLDQLRQLRGAGLKVLPYTLGTAVFTDYDGAEFDLWAEASAEAPAFPPMIVYISASDWETAKNLPLGTMIKPKRIYIDVTDLDVPRLEEYWPSIEILQCLLNAKPPSLKHGRPVGIRTRRKTVLGPTWEEIRTVIRQDPSYYTRWETRYVDAEVGRREKEWLAEQQGTTEVPLKLRRQWRRQAKDNFYHQVVVHPSMRDLNLRSKRRGRRRKN